jgi:hypothetical protein
VSTNLVIRNAAQGPRSGVRRGMRRVYQMCFLGARKLSALVCCVDAGLRTLASARELHWFRHTHMRAQFDYFLSVTSARFLRAQNF